MHEQLLYTVRYLQYAHRAFQIWLFTLIADDQYK